MTERNWNNEKEALEKAEQAEYWKPEEGQFKIKFLDNGVERQFDWEGQIILKVDFKVKVDNKDFVWSVTKGRTTGSLYGQIATIGADNGSLVGREITLYVKGQKMQRTYFIPEVVEINKKNKVKEERVR